MVELLILNNNTKGNFDLVIEAFTALETVPTVVVIGNVLLKVFVLNSLEGSSTFVVRSNPNLEELVSAAKHFGDLFVESNAALRIISFPALFEVTRTLNINNNCAITFLDGFPELKRVGKSITIADNKSLSDIKTFDKLRYIGSNCATYNELVPLPCCTSCSGAVVVDWSQLIVVVPATPPSVGCQVINLYSDSLYDGASDACAYTIPADFFIALCNENKPCCDPLIGLAEPEIPSAVSYSLIIFRNQRLRLIEGFSTLKQVNSNIYIISNLYLCTIKAFGQLASALDIWIRNNPALKQILGFENLISVRNFVVSETPCLADLNGLKSLEFAQRIFIEARSTRSVKTGKHPIPTVSGIILYYTFRK